MRFEQLPSELIEWILCLSNLDELLYCQAVCRRFRDIITSSPRLTYKLDLALAGYIDDHVSPSCPLDTRRRMLASAQRLWKNPGSFALVESLSLANLSYWPARDGILLRGADPDGDDKTFDITVVSHTAGPPTRSWRVQLPVTETGILCLEPAQDLAVVRTSVAGVEEPHAQYRWFACTALSLRTGKPHPLAEASSIQFEVSERIQSKPHYTRVQVLGRALAISMASGFQFFTEIAVFDWVTGEQTARFCSSATEPRAWGDPAVLISPTCFLLASYDRATQTPAIGVHIIDPSACDAVQIASYSLPRVRRGEVRMIMTPSSEHRVWADDEAQGYLSTDPESLMLRVYVYNTQIQLREAGFFMPLRTFFQDAETYFARKDAAEMKVVPWARWMKHTRWLDGSGTSWMQDVRRNQKGVGSRYFLAGHIIDFSPTDLARELSAREKTDADTKTFRSDTGGFTVHAESFAGEDVSGSELFKDPIVSSLPYRHKSLPELPAYSPDSDLHLVGDKLVTVEGGVLDEVKIYQLLPENPADT